MLAPEYIQRPVPRNEAGFEENIEQECQGSLDAINVHGICDPDLHYIIASWPRSAHDTARVLIPQGRVNYSCKDTFEWAFGLL